MKYIYVDSGKNELLSATTMAKAVEETREILRAGTMETHGHVTATVRGYADDDDECEYELESATVEVKLEAVESVEEEYDLAKARATILDCEDPSVAASSFFSAVCEVDRAGDIWIADRNCWADDTGILNLAIWLREQ